jgi:hypothetical protein
LGLVSVLVSFPEWVDQPAFAKLTTFPVKIKS